MPIYSPTGFLDVTNATLRGSKIVTTSNVGVANLNPLNTLSVGSNLQVEDTGSNVLTVRGNAAAAAMTLGVITIAPSYSLEIVSNIGNTVSNTVQFTNDTTGFVTTANIEVGTGNLFVDTTTGEVTVGEQLTVTNRADVTDFHASNLTVASALYANAASGRVGVHTTNPGNFALDVHGSANVGALTANSLIVTGNLAVAGEFTSIRTSTVTVDDPIIGLANNNTSDPAVLDIGFVMARPSTADGSNVAIIFDESTDTLEIGYTQGKHTDTTITMDDSSLFHTNIHGNVSVSNLNIGQFSVVPSYGLDHVTNENNSTGDTIISTNGTTGLQTTANVNVGRDALVSGNVAVSQDLTVTGTSAISGDLTVDTSTFHVDSSTNRVGILTTSPGATLEVSGNVAVSSNLEVGTANLFVDTVSGNVGIGITDPGHNLDIVSEMNLRAVSNTASIKYNSNVVTEYVRSKKLIKYPREALTSASQNGYVVTASNDVPGTYDRWEAFDGGSGNVVGWYTGDTGAYNGSDGLYSGSTRLATETELGDWIGLELPELMNPQYIKIYEQSYSKTTHGVDKAVLYAKKQSSDTWTNIGEYPNIVGGQSFRGVQLGINSTETYRYFALVITKRHIASNTGGISIRELEFYGLPEYDADANGTDVIMRSVPNEPNNTDWLEIYWDAANSSSYSGNGSTTVTDISPGGGVNGTIVGNNNFDSIFNAWEFNGNGDYIYSSLSGYTTANFYTASVWIKPQKLITGSGCIFQIGNGSNNNSIGMIMYDNGQIRTFIYGNNQIDLHYTVKPDEWTHVSSTYDASVGYLTVYINGIFAGYDDSGSAFSLTSTPYLTVGVQTGSTDNIATNTYFRGSIANFRFFNRKLSNDEIWQLYAYQKEYFNVSPNVVTFKNGRLGINTLEPKAQLDVNGSISCYSTGRLSTAEQGLILYPEDRRDYFVLAPGYDGWLRTLGKTYDNMNGFYTSLAVGNFYAAGSLRFSSDDRIKHFEEEIQGSLDIINQLVPYKYKKTQKVYSEDYTGEIGEEGKDWNWEIGLIAQHIKEIPYLKFAVIDEKNSPEKIYGLTYNNFIGLLIQGVKDLNSLVETKETRIQALETQLALVLSRLDALENP